MKEIYCFNGNRKLLPQIATVAHRYWCYLLSVALVFIISIPNVEGQIITSGATVKADFGIDADIYSNLLTVHDSDSILNTDDWFENLDLFPGSGTGSGNGVIDQTNAEAVKALVQSNYNYSFTRRMSVDRNTPVGPSLWIDAVYNRDWNSQGNFIDSTVFTGGQDKNGGNPATWSLGTGGTPQKNDLVDVMGHMREHNDSVYGIGAFTTISSDGNSHADFEFFQGQLEYDLINGNLMNLGPDSGHVAWEFDELGITQVGDLIVSIDFENGGTSPFAAVRLWMSEETFDALTLSTPPGVVFQLTGEFDSGEDAEGFGYAEIEAQGAVTVAWAIVNVEQDVLGAPWGSLEAKAYYDDIKMLQYAEFAINLTSLGIGFGGTDPCNKTLGSLMVKTRSSSSFTAELKDFSGPHRFGYDLTTDVVVHDSEECQDEVSYDIDLTANVDTTFGNIITYHNSFDDADNLEGIITDSTEHNIPANEMPKTIYVRASNPADQECYVVDSFKIGFYPNPALEVADLEDCENGDTGLQSFNLGDAIVTNGGGTPTYHANMSDADNGTNSISAAVTVAIGDSTFWVRTVSSDGCDSIAMLTVTVYDNPDLMVSDLEDCEDGTTGAQTFDLLDAVDDADGGSLSYYATEADALAESNGISSSVTVAIGDSIFWIRSDNDSDSNEGCFSIQMVTVKVYDNPDLMVSDLEECEDGSGVQAFDLADAVDDADGGSLSYYATEADAQAESNAISSSVTVSVGDSVFWIRSDNDSDSEEGCNSIEMVTVTVNPNPVCDITEHQASNQYLYDGSAKVNTPDIVSYYWYTTNGTIGGGQGTDSIWGLEGSLGGILYFVDLVDVNGCTVTCTARIVAPTYAPPPCNIATVDATCDGASDGSAKIATVPANYTEYLFEWYALPDEDNVISNDTMITGLIAGDYKLVITDTSLTIPQSVNCTGTVGDRDPVTLICPNDTFVTTCLTSSEVAAAFDEWMARVIVINSDSMLTTDWDSTTYPDACGDSVSVVWTLHDECAIPGTCTAYFKVPDDTPVSVTGPSDMTVTHCDYADQAALDAAFTTWIDSFAVVSNECGATPTDLSSWSAPDLCEGGSVPVVFGLADNCSADTARATFTVTPSTDVDVTGPDSVYYSTCEIEDQDELNDMFDKWLAEFDVLSNECGADTLITQGWYPDLCEGDTVEITISVNDNCSNDSYTAVFGVTGDNEDPVFTSVEPFIDSLCNASPIDTLWAYWTDNCTELDSSWALPTLSESATCYKIWEYYFEATDDCGNTSDTAVYVLERFDLVGDECETVFGRLDGSSICFSDLVDNDDEQLFHRWGWTNRIDTRNLTYVMDLYAGAAHCEIENRDPVGTVSITWHGDSVDVVYEMFPGQYLSEVHVYVGYDKFPTLAKGNKPKPTVAPGQYTVVVEGSDNYTGAEVLITNVQDPFWIIAHGVACELQCVCDGEVGEGGKLEGSSDADTTIYWPDVYPAMDGLLLANGSAKDHVKRKSAELTTSIIPGLEEGDLKVYPNPFDEVVNIEFVSPVSGHAVLEIHNMVGQRVATLLDDYVEAGVENKVQFRPESEVSGFYLYRLDIDGDIQIGKMIYRKE